MADMSETPLKNAFDDFLLLSFCSRFRFAVIKNSFGKWLCTDEATNHYLNQWWFMSLTIISTCVTRTHIDHRRHHLCTYINTMVYMYYMDLIALHHIMTFSLVIMQYGLPPYNGDCVDYNSCSNSAIHWACIPIMDHVARWPWLGLLYPGTNPFENRVPVEHYSDVIMTAMASQITVVSIVYSTVYIGEDQRKHQSSSSLAFVRGIHRWPVNSPHKGP